MLVFGKFLVPLFHHSSSLNHGPIFVSVRRKNIEDQPAQPSPFPSFYAGYYRGFWICSWHSTSTFVSVLVCPLALLISTFTLYFCSLDMNYVVIVEMDSGSQLLLLILPPSLSSGAVAAARWLHQSQVCQKSLQSIPRLADWLLPSPFFSDRFVPPPSIGERQKVRDRDQDIFSRQKYIFEKLRKRAPHFRIPSKNAVFLSAVLKCWPLN